MHAWESIQKALDYIDANITQKLTPEELAEVAALSPFYFQRLFTKLVRRPVGEYIKLRRLAKAAEALKNKERRILDVALEYGFSSHEAFTKAFKAAYGITPSEFRATPVRLNQIVKPDLLLNYTVVDEGIPLIADDIVIEIVRKKLVLPERYIGLSAQVPLAQTPTGETTGIDVPGQLWDEFHQSKAKIPGLLPDGIELGASTMSQEEGTFLYFVGASADMKTPEPEGYTVWELPAAEYIVCLVEAENFMKLVSSALGKAMKYLFETWFKDRSLVAQPFSAEKYYKSTPDATSMELWVIPVPVDQGE